MSDAWIDKLNSVAQSHLGLSEVATDIELVIEYRVVGETLTIWQIKIDKGNTTVTCSNGDWEIVKDLQIDEFSRTKIDASVQELSEERDTVSDLGLI